MLYVGAGPRGSNGARFTLHQILVTPLGTHNQIGPLWCWFPSGWACAHSRSLWVSPMTSPVRLGVSPAAAPTPTGIFRGLRLYFPELEPWVTQSASLPAVRPVYLWANLVPRGVLPAALPAPFSATLSPALWVYLCKCGATGSASARTACAICPTLRQSQSRHSHASPLHPGAVSAPPTSLDE